MCAFTRIIFLGVYAMEMRLTFALLELQYQVWASPGDLASSSLDQTGGTSAKIVFEMSHLSSTLVWTIHP